MYLWNVEIARTQNTSIGNALVDDTTLKWEYFKPFDGLTNEEIKKTFDFELKKRGRLSGKECLGSDPASYSHQVDDEPDPSKDYLKCYSQYYEVCKC